MEKENISEKAIQPTDANSLDDDEEIAFIEYQETITRSKEAKRNRLILIALSVAVYLLGLGIFATIVQTIHQINEIAGIVVGITLLVCYTICFVIVLVGIYSKESFDIQQRKKSNVKFSERRNNHVRFSIARNIKDQSLVLDYLEKEQNKEYLSHKEAEKVESFEIIIEIASRYPDHIPSYQSEDSIALSNALSIAMGKDGVLYKKAKSLIMKRAMQTGCLTALSQNAMVDMSIVAIKDIQLIKDLIWLYGFRPDNAEMTRIMLKVLRNVCISIGLNNIPKHANMIGKIFNKDSNNFLVQLFGQVLDMSAQFVGNGTMTYLIGRYTIKVLLHQYHLQEILHQKSMEEYQLDISSKTLDEINAQIKVEVKQLKDEKKQLEETKPLMIEDTKEKKGFFHNLFHSKKKEKKTK
jgi:uncharacterized membrane protein YcjF (UPF0283 family)